MFRGPFFFGHSVIMNDVVTYTHTSSRVHQ